MMTIREYTKSHDVKRRATDLDPTWQHTGWVMVVVTIALVLHLL